MRCRQKKSARIYLPVAIDSLKLHRKILMKKNAIVPKKESREVGLNRQWKRNKKIAFDP